MRPASLSSARCRRCATPSASRRSTPSRRSSLGYLNVVGFGGQIYGVASAAHYYFNTTADKLTLPQAATLVAMLNNPANLRIDEPKNTANGAANGYKATKDRRDYVLDRMYVNHKITKAAAGCGEGDPGVADDHAGRPPDAQRAARYNAAFFCDYVRDVVLNDPAFGATSDARWATLTRGGLKIYTTLNLDLQATAQQSLSSYIPATGGRASTWVPRTCRWRRAPGAS